MTDRMRWRYGDTNPVVAAVNSATIIEIGDLVYQDVDNAKPAGLKDYESVEGFAALFLGVAMQGRRSGDTYPIRVATTGVFEFDCPRGTFELGDWMAPDKIQLINASGTPAGAVLANQRLIRVDDVKEAIGRVAKRVSHASNTVFVDIRSTVMTGGIAGTTSIARGAGRQRRDQQAGGQERAANILNERLVRIEADVAGFAGLDTRRQRAEAASGVTDQAPRR